MGSLLRWLFRSRSVFELSNIWSIGSLVLAFYLTSFVYISLNTVMIDSAKKRLIYHEGFEEFKTAVEALRPRTSGEFLTDEQKNAGPSDAWLAFEEIPDDLEAKAYKKLAPGKKMKDRRTGGEVSSWLRFIYGLHHLEAQWKEDHLIPSEDGDRQCLPMINFFPASDSRAQLFDIALGVRVKSEAGIGLFERLGLVRSGLTEEKLGVYEYRGLQSLNGYAYALTRPVKSLSHRDCRQVRENVDAFELRMIEEMTRMQDVIWLERWGLRAFNGFIQWFVFALGLWGTLRMFIRAFQRKIILPKVLESKVRQAIAERVNSASSADGLVSAAADVELSLRTQLIDSSRAVDTWLIATIPLIGFIGTVLGMINAMELIGDVVIARPGAELVSAMGGIAGALSVAFYTTLVALIFTIPLSLIQVQVYGAESRTLAAVTNRILAKVNKDDDDDPAPPGPPPVAPPEVRAP